MCILLCINLHGVCVCVSISLCINCIIHVYVPVYQLAYPSGTSMIVPILCVLGDCSPCCLICARECPVGGGGYMGYVRKALEKGYLEQPESACCTDDMFEIFVRFGRCLCCLLPRFVNRQLPPTTGQAYISNILCQ